MTGWLTLAGAVIVALITAVTTDRRLSRQIDAERERQERDLMAAAERQERELTAEAERQRTTLAHDRELADLAGLRILLDEAAMALDAGEAARSALQVAFAEHGRNTSQFQEIMDEAKASGTALFALRERLAVRVGQEGALSRGFHKSALALLKTWNAISTLDGDDSGNAFEASRAIVRVSRNEYEQGFKDFTKAAVATAGVVTTSHGEPATGAKNGASTVAS